MAGRISKPLTFALCLAALSAAAFMVGMHGSGQATLLSGARAAGTEDLVLNAEMVAGEEGWALTSQALSWTEDGGRTWRPVGPPEVADAATHEETLPEQLKPDVATEKAGDSGQQDAIGHLVLHGD